MPPCGKCHRDAPTGALFCAFCGASIVPERSAGEPVDPYIGQTFKGMYFIQQRVGGGGMGQVYKAVHVTLDAPVALKILKKALLADPSVVQRFHREARAASRLRHPNVINVTDFGQTDDGTLFMAMEYVAGKSLARVIAEDFPLSEQRVVHIGAQILAALAEAHAGQILHRDLKPENVMLEVRRDEADSVKVLDFGIAKITLPGDGQGTLTQAGLVCGTPGYMSPEQWSGQQLDARSDLYSVGVILYEMLTGRLPFEAQTPMEMVRKHLTERPLPPSQRRSDGQVSPDLEALVMRALSANVADRPNSAEEMRDDLLACVLAPEPQARAGAGPAKTMVMDRAAAAAAAARRPSSSAGRRTTSAPPRAPPGPELEAQATTMSPAAGGRTPGSSAGGEGAARPPTPAASRRPPTGPGSSSPRGTPVPQRRTPAPVRRTQPPVPRHEADEEEADEVPPPPPPRSRLPLYLGAAAGAVALAVMAFFLFKGSDKAAPALTLSGIAPASVPAAGGTPLVIGGTGFEAGLAVTLGDSPVPVLEATPTSLKTAAPAHAAGTVDVVVAAKDGRRAVLPGGLTFVAPTPPPPPQADPIRLVAVSPASGPTSGGTAVNISGGGFAAGAKVTFGGVEARVSSTSAGTIAAVAPAHEPGSVEVVVVHPDGRQASLPDGFSYALSPAHKTPVAKKASTSGQGAVKAVRESLNALPTPAAVTGDGVISVQVEPFGDVFLDERAYGEAPREFRVAAGTYLVRARHPQLGQREQRITVRAGERTRWTFDLTKKR